MKKYTVIILAVLLLLSLCACNKAPALKPQSSAPEKSESEETAPEKPEQEETAPEKPEQEEKEPLFVYADGIISNVKGAVLSCVPYEEGVYFVIDGEERVLAHFNKEFNEIWRTVIPDNGGTSCQVYVTGNTIYVLESPTENHIVTLFVNAFDINGTHLWEKEFNTNDNHFDFAVTVGDKFIFSYAYDTENLPSDKFPHRIIELDREGNERDMSHLKELILPYGTSDGYNHIYTDKDSGRIFMVLRGDDKSENCISLLCELDENYNIINSRLFHGNLGQRFFTLNGKVNRMYFTVGHKESTDTAYCLDLDLNIINEYTARGSCSYDFKNVINDEVVLYEQVNLPYEENMVHICDKDGNIIKSGKCDPWRIKELYPTENGYIGKAFGSSGALIEFDANLKMIHVELRDSRELFAMGSQIIKIK